MPPKRKSNATKKKGDASQPTARRSSPDPSAGNSSACTPAPRQRSQAGVADTVSKNTAPVSTSRAAAAMNNEDAAVCTASVPGHSQAKKGRPARWPGRVAKRGRAPANAPKDVAEQTSESPNSPEPAGADVDGSTVTTEPAIKTTAKRRLAVRGPPAKRPAAANASDPGQEFTSPSRSSPSDSDATASSAVTVEQLPVKAGKRGRAAARQGAESPALSTQGQHAALDVSKAKGGRNTGSPVRPLSTHSEPAGTLVEDGERAGTVNSTEKEAAKRGRPAKSKAATTALQQKDHHELPAYASNLGDDSESQNPSLPRKKSLGQLKQPVLVTSGGMDVSDVEAENSLAKGMKRGRASGPIEAATSESQELGEQGPPAKEAAKLGRPDKSKAATTALQQKDHHELPAYASNLGDDSESQNPSLPRKKSLGRLKQPVLVTSGGMDVSDVEAENSLAKGMKRGRASGPIEAATSESQELGKQGAKMQFMSGLSLTFISHHCLKCPKT